MTLPNLNFDALSRETRPQPSGEAASTASNSREGQPKRRRAGTPRGRVTERDAALLAFAGLFPAADAESFSMLSFAEASVISTGGDLPTVKSTAAKLLKLERLGAVERHRHAVTGDLLYGLTPLGYSYATEFGHELVGWTRLEGLSLERLNHYRMIARTAALLLSPVGYYAETLNLQPLTLADLVTEKAMRQDFAPVKEQLARAKKAGKGGDFGRWRAQDLNEALGQIKAGRLQWSDLAVAHPALLTVGFPQREGGKEKAVHQPDLAVVPVSRTTAKSPNLLVEVELTRKSWPAYDAILATFAAELARPFIYSRAVYFTPSNAVETLLRRVDTAGGYGLFDSGKLAVVPILNRDGQPVRSAARVVVGGAA